MAATEIHRHLFTAEYSKDHVWCTVTDFIRGRDNLKDRSNQNKSRSFLNQKQL
jgi:hypothetical protein